MKRKIIIESFDGCLPSATIFGHITSKMVIYPYKYRMPLSSIKLGKKQISLQFMFENKGEAIEVASIMLKIGKWYRPELIDRNIWIGKSQTLSWSSNIDVSDAGAEFLMSLCGFGIKTKNNKTVTVEAGSSGPSVKVNEIGLYKSVL